MEMYSENNEHSSSIEEGTLSRMNTNVIREFLGREIYMSDIPGISITVIDTEPKRALAYDLYFYNILLGRVCYTYVPANLNGLYKDVEEVNKIAITQKRVFKVCFFSAHRNN